MHWHFEEADLQTCHVDVCLSVRLLVQITFITSRRDRLGTVMFCKCPIAVSVLIAGRVFIYLFIYGIYSGELTAN